MIRIVAATEVGGAGRLASLWRAVFPGGARPAGWFSDKLRRGHVVDALSQVAVDGDPTDPRAWRGFVLVGTPPSLYPRARTAGTGVIEACRGRGLGRRLLDAASEATATAGLRALELLAQPDRVAFYLRAGFASQDTRVTLQAEATGRGAPGGLTRDDATSPAPDASRWTLVFAWSPEAWDGSSDRSAIDEPATHALVSRVGESAWLVHRWAHRAQDQHDLERAAVALLGALPQGHSVLIPLVPAVSQITARLVPVPFSVVQRAELLVRTLPATND